MRGKTGFLAGFITASLIFGGLGIAADSLQKDITVSYTPLTYMFDEVEKAPPQDQQGFIYNGRTFVSLRFAAESLGEEVQFDAETYTIYIGRRASAVPAVWNDAKRSSASLDNLKLEYFTDGLNNVRGHERSESLLLSAYAMKGASTPQPVQLEKTIPLDSGLTEVSGRLFVPDTYYGRDAKRRVAQITFLNERNELLEATNFVDPSDAVVDYPFAYQFRGVMNLRMIITLYPSEGIAVSDEMLMAQVGLQDFTIKKVPETP